jgi:hypothetical protein
MLGRGRRNAKRGNYRDFSGAMPAQAAPMLSLSQIKMVSFKSGAIFIRPP